mgnify:CR=1 FL=1
MFQPLRKDHWKQAHRLYSVACRQIVPILDLSNFNKTNLQLCICVYEKSLKEVK